MTPTTRRAGAALAVAAGLVLAAAPAGAGELTRAEQAGRAKVAREWADLAEWCVRQDLAAEARQVAALAEAAAPDPEAAAELVRAAAACEEGASARDRERFARKRASTGRKVARVYDELVGLADRTDDAAVAARLRGHLVDALEAEPTDARWGAVLELLTAATEGEDGGDLEAAVALAERALALEPPEEVRPHFEAALDLAAVDRVVLRRAAAHPMRYFLSLPKAWRPDSGRTWPVLVAVEGAGSGFRGMARGYARARGDLPFIVVTPCSFANTNAIEGKKLEKYQGWYDAETIAAAERDRFGWDEAGLLAVLEEVAARFDGAERAFVTGFSGGGNLTYLMIFRHPDRVAGAAPACANFSRSGYARLKGEHPPEALDLPIHILTGADDPHREHTHGDPNQPGIEPQTDLAERLLAELGYPNVRRTLVPGLGHSPARGRVLDVLRPYITGERERGDPLD